MQTHKAVCMASELKNKAIQIETRRYNSVISNCICRYKHSHLLSARLYYAAIHIQYLSYSSYCNVILYSSNSLNSLDSFIYLSITSRTSGRYLWYMRRQFVSSNCICCRFTYFQIRSIFIWETHRFAALSFLLFLDFRFLLFSGSLTIWLYANVLIDTAEISVTVSIRFLTNSSK